MTILTLFFFVVIMAMGGLAIDIGRLYGVHGQVQTYVDDVALASASQLDGQDNAIQRACDAAVGQGQCYWNGAPHGAPKGPIVTTSYSFTATEMAVQSLTFLSSLAAGRVAASGDTVVCIYDVQNRVWTTQCSTGVSGTQYVTVTSAPMGVAYWILPVADMFLGANGIASSATFQVQATAGYVQETCGFAPMLICNPEEPAGNSDPNYPINIQIGRQIKVTDGSSNGHSPMAPGNFGFISPSAVEGGTTCNGLNGEKQLECMLAAVAPSTQCIKNGGHVPVQTGQASNRYDALNVRFDMYGSAGGGNNIDSGSSAFRPGPDVMKGLCGNSGCDKCSNKYKLAPTTVPLPRDASFTQDGNASSPTGAVGTGVTAAALTNYWTKAHPTASMPNVTDRWGIYTAENTSSGIPNFSPSGENGTPICYTGTQKPKFDANLDRRELVVAVVNCNYENVHGSAVAPRVMAYMKIFMTEPIGFDDNQTSFNSSSNKTMYAEFRGLVTPNDKSGLTHSMAVLYR